jgi:hypothetical protein
VGEEMKARGDNEWGGEMKATWNEERTDLEMET